MLIALSVLTCALVAQPKLHSELARVDIKRALVGHSIVTEEGGAATYTLAEGGKATYSGVMGARGEGQWSAPAKNTLSLKGTGIGGPCGGEEACDERWSWSATFTDIWMSSSGLLLLEQKSIGRWLLEGDKKKRCETAANNLVKLIPGAKDRALFEGVVKALKKAQMDAALVHGAPAKRPRTVSQIWYVPKREEAKEMAESMAKALRKTIGKVEVQKWTFSDTRYDVLVIVGDRQAP